MAREGGRDPGLDNLKLINLGSYLPQNCNEKRGGKEERGTRQGLGVMSWWPVAHGHIVLADRAFACECYWRG